MLQAVHGLHRAGSLRLTKFAPGKFVTPPAKLERLIKMIDKERWSTLPADVKGDIYEGLLEAAALAMAQASFSTYRSHLLPGSRGTRTSMFIAHAQDVKGGAGQYSARASCFALPPAPCSRLPRVR